MAERELPWKSAGEFALGRPEYKPLVDELCWQPAKMGHLGTREIRGLIEV